MIPPNLAAFRALMRLAEQCATELHERHHSAECTDCELYETATMCDALATATPAQLCGIVGEVEARRWIDLDRVDYIVTPREGEG